MTERRRVGLKVLLGFLWLICLYRAITQSIVHDESLTYGLYIQAPFSQIFHYFDANHHFLNTLLMKLSVSLFGVSEWSMRLPALLGAGVYFAAVYRICVREFRTDYACVIAAALLTLNPFILDFMVAARGYGMATGFLMWTMATLLEFLRDPEETNRRALILAGVAASLSVMANLVFVVPALGLLGLVWLILKQWRPETPVVVTDPVVGKKNRARRKSKVAVSPSERALQAFWLCLALPTACGLALFFLVSPLAEAKAGDLYAGAHTIAESLRSLYDAAFVHGGVLRGMARTGVLAAAVTYLLVPAIAIGGLVLGIRRRNILLTLASGTAVASAIALVVLHVLVSLLYPLDRTGIYFLPLLALTLAGLADLTRPIGAVRVASYAVALVFGIQFLLEFDMGKFLVWEYDADTRTILEQLSKTVSNRQAGSVRLANSWQLEPSLNFYAMKENLTWLAPITRDPVGPGADYYVLMGADKAAVESLRLRTLYTGKNSGTILATPQ